MLERGIPCIYLSEGRIRRRMLGQLRNSTESIDTHERGDYRRRKINYISVIAYWHFLVQVFHKLHPNLCRLVTTQHVRHKICLYLHLNLTKKKNTSFFPHSEPPKK